MADATKADNEVMKNENQKNTDKLTPDMSNEENLVSTKGKINEGIGEEEQNNDLASKFASSIPEDNLPNNHSGKEPAKLEKDQYRAPAYESVNSAIDANSTPDLITDPLSQNTERAEQNNRSDGGILSKLFEKIVSSARSIIGNVDAFFAKQQKKSGHTLYNAAYAGKEQSQELMASRFGNPDQKSSIAPNRGISELISRGSKTPENQSQQRPKNNIQAMQSTKKITDQPFEYSFKNAKSNEQSKSLDIESKVNNINLGSEKIDVKEAKGQVYKKPQASQEKLHTAQMSR